MPMDNKTDWEKYAANCLNTMSAGKKWIAVANYLQHASVFFLPLIVDIQYSAGIPIQWMASLPVRDVVTSSRISSRTGTGTSSSAECHSSKPPAQFVVFRGQFKSGAVRSVAVLCIRIWNNTNVLAGSESEKSSDSDTDSESDSDTVVGWKSLWKIKNQTL
jgi:hypothetical protein